MGAGWPGNRFGAARTRGSESVVRGTNERGCRVVPGWGAQARASRIYRTITYKRFYSSLYQVYYTSPRYCHYAYFDKLEWL